MTKYLLLLFMCTGVIHLVYAQDPEFTQFYANPLYLNPAFAGTSKDIRCVFNYRNQWVNLPASFLTYSASYDQHFDDISGGVGVQLLYDRAGDGELTTTSGSFMYSYFLPLSKKFAIKAALEMSAIQKRIDVSKLLFYSQIDNKLGFIKPPPPEDMPPNGIGKTGPFLDFDAGFIGYTDKFYAGFSVAHISEPQMSFYDNSDSKLPRKYTAHMGFMFPLDNTNNPKKFFSPNILFQKQENFSQLNLGAYYIRDFLFAGVWYRESSQNPDAIMLLIGLQKSVLKFGYSYDMTLSDVRSGGRGSHEISITIDIPTYKNESPVKWRKLPCPAF